MVENSLVIAGWGGMRWWLWVATWWREEERVIVDGLAYIDTLIINFSSHELYVKINEKN